MAPVDTSSLAQPPVPRRGNAGLYVRIVFLVLVSAFLLAALLNAFGQRQAVSHASGKAGSLTVSSPSHVRGGLLYQARFRIRARREIKEPRLVLSEGWFEQTSVNAIVPEPSEEQSEQGRVSLSFDPIEAGDSLVVWIYFQVNPTNVGSHLTNAVLRDGSTKLVEVRRTQTNLP